MAAEDAKRIEIRGMDKHYGAFHAVKDLSLTVEPGEFLVLLGPSGCGKSTALRMIAGLEEITAGQVLLGDRDVTHVLPKYRDIAMVFQSYALYPHKTVAENIGFPLKIAGASKADQAAAIQDAAAQVQLDQLLERYPRELSGGQRQRVALARAIIRRPAAFLMDEPLSNLDAKLRGAMRAELKRMQKDLGVTTIYVTHDQIEAMTLAHRVAIMKDGELQQLGTPREVYRDPANMFVAGFMGSPPMNFVEGPAADGAIRVGDGALPLDGLPVAEGRAVTVGFRPEDAALCPPEDGTFTAEVFIAEMTGDETLVTLSGPKDEHIVVRADPDIDIADGARVGLAVDPSKRYYFDAATGDRLRPGRTG
ncbi:MAG: ABC transporter ATP-binding protein [Pseudomonadota bacterium]